MINVSAKLDLGVLASNYKKCELVPIRRIRVLLRILENISKNGENRSRRKYDDECRQNALKDVSGC